MTNIATDTFIRANASGWGTASDAETWAVVTGSSANFSIAGNEGVITGATGIQVAYLGSQTSADMEMLIRFSVSAILDTPLILLRGTANNTHYRIRQRNGTFEIRRAVAGATTLLASTAFTLTAGSFYWIRARIQSSTISANIWVDGGSEPGSWMLSTTDSSPISGTGQFGLGSTLNATGDTLKFDHLTLDNLAGAALTATCAGVGMLIGTLATTGVSLATTMHGVGTLSGVLSASGVAPPDNPYGLTIGLNPGCGNTASNYAYWTQLFADMRSKGMAWLRFQLSWCSIEITAGVYTWTALDDAVSQCNANNIKILYTLRGAPTWALVNAAQKATDEPFYLPDPTLMAGFATQVATRYDGAHGHGHIDAFGFNEDFSIHFTNPAGGFSGIYNNTLYTGLYGNGGPCTSANKYQPARDFHFASPVVAAVRAAIRAANPGIKVGMPCVWWPQPVNVGGLPNTPVSNYTASLQTLYNDLGAGLFDFLDFHYYSNSQAPLVGSNGVSTITQAMTDLRNVATANGDTSIPIYCTEFGWQVPTDVPDYTTQATYYGQVLDAVRAGGTNPNGKIFFFTLDYSTTPGESSLVKWNGTSYIYESAWTTWGNYIIQFPLWGTTAPPPASGQLSVSNGQIVESSTGKRVLLRGLNTAGLEFSDGIGQFTQARINAFAAKFNMNLWRLCVNVSWWNNNVLLPGGVTHYRDWIQQVIGWMKAAGCYVEIDPTNYATIPPANSGSFCNNPPITTVDSDTFTRANQSGWGTPSGGGTWITTGSATLSIAGNEGVLSGTAAANTFMRIGANTATDLELSVRFALTNSNHVYGGVFLRYTDTDNCYIVYADTTNLYFAKRVAGVQTQIATVAKTFTSGTFYNINVYALGTQISVVAWQDGTTIPNTYDIQATDSSRTSGFYGLYSFDTNPSDSVQFDHYVASAPQTACIISQNTQNFPPWTEAQQTAAVVSFFQSFVPIYVNDPAILYNALNEPAFWGQAGVLADNTTVIAAIRAIAPTSLIFAFAQGSSITDYPQGNIVLDFHVYDGSPTWQTQLAWWTTPGIIPTSEATTIGEWNVNTSNDPNSFGGAVANAALTRGVANTYYNADNLLQSDNVTLTTQGLIVQAAFAAEMATKGTGIYTIVIGGIVV